jgi:hypothetical protein
METDPRPLAQPDGSVVHRDPEVHSGAPVFVGTRVPVQTFVEYLEGGVYAGRLPGPLPERPARAGHRFPAAGRARTAGPGGVRRVLFDEDVPRPLRRDLPPGFEIRTVVEAGWAGVKNGELLRRAEENFDPFLTADRNLAFQQNLARLRLGVVVLAVGSTKLHDLRAASPRIAVALAEVAPGEVLQITQDR